MPVFPNGRLGECDVPAKLLRLHLTELTSAYVSGQASTGKAFEHPVIVNERICRLKPGRPARL